MKRVDHLLVINYALDIHQPIFATSGNWICELAKRHEKITIITGHLGEFERPTNAAVHSIKWIEGQNFRNIFKTAVSGLKVIKKNRFSTAFTHMALMQALILSPLLKVHKIQPALLNVGGKLLFTLKFIIA